MKSFLSIVEDVAGLLRYRPLAWAAFIGFLCLIGMVPPADARERSATVHVVTEERDVCAALRTMAADVARRHGRRPQRVECVVAPRISAIERAHIVFTFVRER